MRTSLSERLLENIPEGAEASAAAASAATAPAPRVDLLDNAKSILIVCVVLYHTAVVYTSADRSEVRVRRAK